MGDGGGGDYIEGGTARWPSGGTSIHSCHGNVRNIPNVKGIKKRIAMNYWQIPV